MLFDPLLTLFVLKKLVPESGDMTIHRRLISSSVSISGGSGVRHGA